jgi:hypothetical protein
MSNTITQLKQKGEINSSYSYRDEENLISHRKIKSEAILPKFKEI